MLGQLTRTKVVIGLDIGTHSAKLVVTRALKDRWEVLRASCLRLSPDDQESAETLAEKLLPWLSENAETTGGTCLTSLPSSFVDYEYLEFAESENHDIDQFIAESVKQLLGSSAEKAVFDYWSVDETTKNRSAYVAWTSSEYSSQLSKKISRKGLRCEAIDVPALALARATCANKLNANGRLILDISAGEATFILARADNADFVRNRIHFANQSAAESVASTLGISIENAEQLIWRWGLADETQRDRSPINHLVQSQLEAWLESLVFEFERTVHFLQHRYGANVVEEVVLCGGGAAIRNLDQWLAVQLNMSVSFASLPMKWHWRSAEPFAPIFVQALGLTMYGDIS